MKTQGLGDYRKAGNLFVRVLRDRPAIGKEAARIAKPILHDLALRDVPPFLVWASAPSQHAAQDALLADEEIASYLAAANHLHMDEYGGYDVHTARSFSGDLQQRVIDRLRESLTGSWHPINGKADSLEAEAERQTALWFRFGGAPHIIFGGIGEDNHMAFDAAPTKDRSPGFYVADLPHATRQQQVHDECFRTLDEVPTRAVTLDKEAYILGRTLIMSIPGERKAQAVLDTLQNLRNPKPEVVASYLGRCTGDVFVLLDRASASLARKADLI